MSEDNILDSELNANKIQNSAQIALDAAEAAMDVTTEFAKITNTFVSVKNTVLSLKKIFLISIIITSSLGLLSVVLMALLLFSTMGSANKLVETNQALLTHFTENIQKFNKDIEIINLLNKEVLKVDKEVKRLNKAVETLSASLETFSGDSNFQESLNQINQKLDTSLGKILTKNGELANLTISKVDERLKEQIQATTKSLNLIISALKNRDGKNSAAVKSLRKLQANLKRKITRLEKTLTKERAKKTSNKPIIKKKKEDNVIRFPNPKAKN